MGDLHCGHRAGITPPGFGIEMPKRKYDPKGYAMTKLGRATYDWFEAEVKAVMKERKIDVCVANGDTIDGRGERSGSTELSATDRFVQCRMAKNVIMLTKAPNIVLTYGTAYHTGDKEDYEDFLRDIIEGEKSVKNLALADQVWLKVNGIILDIRHHCGSSSVPYGRITPIYKQKLWNKIWNSRFEQQPDADIIIRSHTHFHTFGGDITCLCMSMPALQAPLTKFGGRRCDGVVDIGFVVFDIDSDGSYTWTPHIAMLPEYKAKVVEF
jgi:hypothetical protein